MTQIISESVLVESKSARSNQLANTLDDRATEILNKAKAVIFAVWQGKGIATTQQVASYYEVEEATIRQIASRNKDEIDLDGVKVLRGKELKDARYSLSLPSKSSQETAWTPRGFLRVGMLLTESEVAKTVRTQILNLIEQVPEAVKTISAQELRIKELELQLSVAQAQAEAAKQSRLYVELNHSIATLHGTPMLALMQGRPEAVIEQIVEVKEVMLCTESGKPIVHTKGVTKTAIAKELGLKKADKFVAWLKSMNREDLLIDGYTAVPCQYVPYESLKELKQLWAYHKGDRQQLLGE